MVEENALSGAALASARRGALAGAQHHAAVRRVRPPDFPLPGGVQERRQSLFVADGFQHRGQGGVLLRQGADAAPCQSHFSRRLRRRQNLPHQQVIESYKN